MDSTTATQPIELPRRDWRVWFGVGSTLFWLFLGFQYISGVVGWESFVTQPADSLGGFLEGAFAPLAFLWLVIGFFLQQRELTHNTSAIRRQYEQMRKTAEQAEVQARAITGAELHQRQETLLLVADRVFDQLAAVEGLLYMSSQTTGDQPAESTEEVAEVWERLGTGDSGAFARRFMALYFRARGDGRSPYDIFFGTDVRTRHSETIARTFERLLTSVRGCDPDGIIEDALMGGPHGYLYGIIQGVRAEGPAG